MPVMTMNKITEEWFNSNGYSSGSAIERACSVVNSINELIHYFYIGFYKSSKKKGIKHAWNYSVKVADYLS
jgi:hypothetical protein